MKRTELLSILVFCSLICMGQNISIAFTGTGAATQIQSITATNLTTNQSVTLPGNETLVLTVNTGIPTVSELTCMGMVFPNPFSGTTTFKAVVQKPQTVYVKVQNLVGQVVAQTKAFVSPGENEFALSVITAGIYMVSLTSEQGTDSYKVICTNATEPGNRIRYLGSSPTNLNNHSNQSNLLPADLKSSQTGYFLGYTLGDIILYRCISGIYTTILADSPTASKNCEVEFSTCTDLGGKSYSVVKIGTQTWMAENLAYLPAVNPPASGSETAIHYYVYGYDGTNVTSAKERANYTNYGVLYNWPAALTACPSGWHLPSDAEWTLLTDYLTNNGYGYGGSGSEIGKSLAANYGWTFSSSAGNVGNDPARNNRSGFTALPGGSRFSNGGFNNLSDDATFWSSSENGSSFAWYRDLFYQYNGVYRNFDYRSLGFSVRCVKDASAANTAPSAGFTINPTQGNTNTNFQFDASASTDAETSLSDLEVRWDWTADGTWETGYSKTKTASHQYSAAGTFSVKMEVKDGGGLTDTETKTVTVSTGDFPVLTTKPVTQIGTTEAQSGGNITSSGGSSITRRGVCWNTTPNPVIDNNPNKTEQTGGIGEYLSLMINLSPNTLYYVRAYATNSAGTGYGDQVTFTTGKIIVTPTVTTTRPITGITQTTATSGGNVTSDGGASVTARGVCWSTTHDPTINNSKTSDGSGIGSFPSNLTGLTAGTNYYVRAYATNSVGTAYGEEVPFISSEATTGTFTDSRDSKTYSWVKIGTQTWMSQNLAYLPAVSPSAIASQTAMHYYVYGYDGTSVTTAKAQANYSTYGALYNWPAALTACPSGWHLPSDAEWTILTNYLGVTAGGKMKEAGTTHWRIPNTGATNESGFTALPGGGRSDGCGFCLLGYMAYFWSSSNGGFSNVLYRGLSYDHDGVVSSDIDRSYGFFVRCLQGAGVMPPSVTTSPITEITQTTAKGGGNVISDGGASVTARGVCWSTSHDPTIANGKTSDGTGTGSFTSNLTGLTAGTNYYVRAYATNSVGTAYGEEVPFTTAGGNTGTFTDNRDSKTYSWVKIGTQTWMSQNLAYLPAVSPSATGSETATNYYVYGYEGTSVSAAKATANYSTYGALYNWPATLTACPSGWHLPSDDEWMILEKNQGMSEFDANTTGWRNSGTVGGKLKESGTTHWSSPNTGATNTSSFTALPGGNRYWEGGFIYLGSYAYFWSSSESGSGAWARGLHYLGDGVYRSSYYRRFGFSVRCLQN